MRCSRGAREDIVQEVMLWLFNRFGHSDDHQPTEEWGIFGAIVPLCAQQESSLQQEHGVVVQLQWHTRSLLYLRVYHYYGDSLR